MTFYEVWLRFVGSQHNKEGLGAICVYYPPYLALIIFGILLQTL